MVVLVTAMASTAIAGGDQVLNVSNPAVVRVRQLIGGTAEYSSGACVHMSLFVRSLCHHRLYMDAINH